MTEKAEPGSTRGPKAPEWVIRRVDGQDQWHVPLIPGTADDEPPWAEVVGTAPKWRGYHFRVTFDAAGSTTELRIHREATAPPLTRRLLQAVPVPRLEHVAHARVRDWMNDWMARESYANVGSDAWFAEFDDAGRNPERDVWLAKVAAAYVDTLGQDSQRQRDAIADRCGISADYVPDATREARQRELLTPTTQGRAGGELTPRALRLLGRHVPAAGPADAFAELHRAFAAREIDKATWRAEFEKLIEKGT